MSKVVWITVLNKERDEDAAKAVHQLVSHYGLQPAGHFWRDELEKSAWAAAREDLVRKDTGLWVVVGGAEDFQKPAIRYGLSMLAAGVQSQRGHGFPMLLVPSSGELDPRHPPHAPGRRNGRSAFPPPPWEPKSPPRPTCRSPPRRWNTDWKCTASRASANGLKWVPARAMNGAG